MTDPKPFEQRSADAIRTLWTLAVVLSVAFVISLGVAIYGLLRITGDEHRTCVIQARGLPAGHALAASMRDIHTLLTIPPSTAAEREAMRRQPPRVHKAVTSLTSDLAAYQAAEATQPQTRPC